MVENTPDSSTDRDTDKACVVCGSRISTEKWHPVASEWDEAGDFHIYAFCSTECRDTWTEEAAPSGEDSSTASGDEN